MVSALAADKLDKFWLFDKEKIVNIPLVLCLIAAFGFGVWPLIARFSGMASSHIAIWTSLATFLGVTMIMCGFAKQSVWSTKGVILCLAAGFINSFGIVAYSRLLSGTTWDLSKYIPLSFGLMIMVIVLGGVVLFREAVTTQKLVGIGLVIVSAWLLR